MVKYYGCYSHGRSRCPAKSPSIPTIVASIITRDLALYECFKRKVVNYHAVAASIKPEVEKLAGRQTTINTIVVAITRFSDTRAKPSGNRSLDVLRDAHITLASDVVNVTIKARKSELYEIAKKIGEISVNLSEPTRMFQLSNSIELVADEDEYDSLIKSISRGIRDSEGEDRAISTRHSPVPVRRSDPGVRSAACRATVQERDQHTAELHR